MHLQSSASNDLLSPAGEWSARFKLGVTYSGDKHWPRRGAINNECTPRPWLVHILYMCVSYLRVGRISRSYDDDGYGAQIGDFHARGPTWHGTAIEGEGLILYDYCHHDCFVYGPSSWSSLTIINTYTTRLLAITVSLPH